MKPLLVLVVTKFEIVGEAKFISFLCSGPFDLERIVYSRTVVSKNGILL